MGVISFFKWLFMRPQIISPSLQSIYDSSISNVKEIISAYSTPPSRTQEQNMIITSYDSLFNALSQNVDTNDDNSRRSYLQSVYNYLSTSTLRINGSDERIYDSGSYRFNENIIRKLGDLLTAFYTSKHIDDNFLRLVEGARRSYNSARFRLLTYSGATFVAAGVLSFLCPFLLPYVFIPSLLSLLCSLKTTLRNPYNKSLESLVLMKSGGRDEFRKFAQGLKTLYEAIKKERGSNNHVSDDVLNMLEEFVKSVVKRFSEATGIRYLDNSGNLDVERTLDEILR